MDRFLPSCYGCRTPGVIKATCRKCNPTVQIDDAQSPTLDDMISYSISIESQLTSRSLVQEQQCMPTLELHIRLLGKLTC
ncbi:hypothetical protein CEXT_3761 [Caerostris extrusa]|uniref:Uncharacterized protein n=1 Tax=Caerostris extrusa TaxID=172846 RepID=A0AAV4QEW5_CAEEX|nr:hypothetical protein CEXT_3761 [Caerostris extrusa]